MATPLQTSPLLYTLRMQYDERINVKGLFPKERLSNSTNLYRRDLFAHFGCVNAIEFSRNGKFLVSGGDDRRVLIWSVDQALHTYGTPAVMRANHVSNIFCLSFDSTASRVFSAGNDDQVIIHDVATGDPLDFFLHEQPVYGLSVDPLNDYVFASACDDGRILIYDLREPPSSEPLCIARYSSAFHAVMFNPVESRLLTTANAKEGIALWDSRKPNQALIQFGSGNYQGQSSMSARFNQAGNQILALRRRLPPVLYSLHSSSQICQFDHPGYYNSCTMKSCSFAGENDEYVLSGSDDFNLYMWKIPKTNVEEQWVDSAHMILRGHRSIVNQVRFHPTNCLIASSGVEKIIKLWSPYPLPNSVGGLVEGQKSCTKQRKVFTHEEYISLVLRTGQFMTHDYSHQSTKEDPRMMAFFDSLVQREIEGWISEEVHSSDIDTNAFTAIPSSHSDSELIFADSDGDTIDLTGSEQEESQNRITQLIAKKRAQLLQHQKLVKEGAEPKRRRTTKVFKSFHQPSIGFISETSDSELDDTPKQPLPTVSHETSRGESLRKVGTRKKRRLLSNDKSKKSASKMKNKKQQTKNSDSVKHRLKYMLAYSDSSDENNRKHNSNPVYFADSSSDVSSGENSVAHKDGRPMEADCSEDEKLTKRYPFQSMNKIQKTTIRASKETNDANVVEASTSSMHNAETRCISPMRYCSGVQVVNHESSIEASSSDDAEQNRLRLVMRTYKCKSKSSKNKKLEQDIKGNLIEHNNNINNNDGNSDSNMEERKGKLGLGSAVPEKVPNSSNGALRMVAAPHIEHPDHSISKISKSDVLNGNNNENCATNADCSTTSIQTSVITSIYSTPNGKQSNQSSEDCKTLDDCKTPDNGNVLTESRSNGSDNSVLSVSCQASCSTNFSLQLQDSSQNCANKNENRPVFKKFRLKNRERIRRNVRNNDDDSEST